jgi:hypothetical protein
MDMTICTLVGLKYHILWYLSSVSIEVISMGTTVSASATSSMQDTTVSHFNASRKDIDIDGRKYRCNKVKVRGEKKNVAYVKYLQCWVALDKANGSKWKPYNEVKASSSTEKVSGYSPPETTNW